VRKEVHEPEENVETDMIQKDTNLMKRILLMNLYIVCLLVLPVVLSHWVWIFVFFALLVTGVFGMMVGSIGYAYSFEIGIVAFLGWLILGSGFMVRGSDYDWIMGLMLLTVSIPAANFFALKMDFERKHLSSEQRQARKYELGGILILAGFVFLLMGTLVIVQGIVSQEPFYYPFGVIFILGIVLSAIGMLITRRSRPSK
jgi:hypothetical protein